MPIAFDPPAHAPHGNLHARPVRAQEDDDASLDVFTQLLLAAANVQDPALPTEASARPGKDDAAGGGADAPLLMLPLPPVSGAVTPGRNVVTIVATDGPVDPRLRPAAPGASRLQDARMTAESALAPAGRSVRGQEQQPATHAAPAEALVASLANPGTAVHADTHRDDSAAPSPASLPQAAEAPAPGAGKAHATPVSAASALAALLAAPLLPAPDKPVQKSALETVAPSAQPAPAPGPASSVAPGTLVETVAAPAFTPGWQDETVSKLAQIVLTRNERAELRLNPAELGPVHVRVELRADQASVQIVAASPETRSALEQSLPQLRDLLAAQGITLGQASVHDGAAQRDARPDAWTPSRLPVLEDGVPAAAETVHLQLRQPNRLVDVFA